MERDRAERRIAAIAGFRDGAARLERLGLLRLAPETREAIRSYHEEVLADVSGETNSASGPAGAPAPHWGLRLAAAGGLLVLLGFGLDLLWPDMADWARIATAIALPALALLLAEALQAAGRDRAFVALLAAVAAGLFALDLKLLAASFNRPAGFELGVAVGAFAAALGHRYRSPVLAFAGLLLGGFALAALVALADGRLWPALVGRLDPIFAAGLALSLLGSAPQLDISMRPAWRLAGLILAGGAMIGLAHPGTSLLPLAPAPEAEGSFVNADGERQWFDAVSRAPGRAHAGWKILRRLGEHLRLEGFDFKTLAEVDRMYTEAQSPTLPPAEIEEVEAAGEAGLWRTGPVPIYAGDWLVRRAGPLQETGHAESGFVIVHPSTAGAAGIGNGARVLLRQSQTEQQTDVRVDDSVPPGSVWMPAATCLASRLGPAWGPIDLESVE